MTAINPFVVFVPSVKQKFDLSLKEMVEMFPDGVIIHNLQKGYLYITGHEGGSPHSVDCRSVFGTSSRHFTARNQYTRQMAYFDAKRIIRLLYRYVSVKMSAFIYHMYE